MRIRQNPDTEYARKIRKEIKSNGGYCVSKYEKTADTKCMCKDFIEMGNGVCSCGLYIKDDIDG